VIARCEDCQFPLGASEEHIEAAVTIGAVQWSEMLMENTLGRWSIDRRDQDDIPFIPLHVFEVLDKEVFEITAPFVAVRLHVGV
jgi:hypothetical protein